MSNKISIVLFVVFLFQASYVFSESSLVAVLKGHSSVSSVTFSPDGKKALSTSQGDGVRYWDIETKKLISHLKGHKLHSLYSAWDVKFSPNGDKAVSCGQDKRVILWDLTKLQEEKVFEGHPYGVNSVAFSPNGENILSAGQGGKVFLWDIKSNKEIVELVGHYKPYGVGEIFFSSNGENALSASQEQKIIIWDLANRKIIKTYGRDVYSGGPIYLFPDWERAISLKKDRKTITLWSLSTGQEIREINGPVDPHLDPHSSSRISTIVVSPDGEKFVTGSGDGELTLWSIEGKVLKRYVGRTGGIYAVAFSPDGRFLLSGGKNGMLYLWSIN